MERIYYDNYKPTDPVYRTHTFRYYCARGFVEKGWRVLDLGCGCGFGSEILGKVAAAVLGIDVHQATTEHAKKAHSVNGVSFFCSSAEEFKYPGPADMTVMIEALEHFDDPEGVLLKVMENTKHRIFVTIPIIKTVGVNPHHKTDWTFQGFNDLMIRLGKRNWQIIHYAIQDKTYYMSCWQDIRNLG